MFQAPSLLMFPTVVWHCTPSCSRPSTIVCSRSIDERLRREHVAAAAHHAAMAARPGKRDLERIGARPHETRPRDHGSRFREARDVEPDDRIGMVVVEQAFRDHRFGAADDLLGRLKHEQVLAAHIPDAIDQRSRDADHDPHVRVVPARVHAAVHRRRELDA